MITKFSFFLLALLFALISAATFALAAADEQQQQELISPYVTPLTAANFDEKLKEHPFWFIKFYAPWCGHCQQLAPTWLEFGAQLETSTGVKVGKIDCTAQKNGEICDRYHVRGYPTLIFFKDGEQVMEYEQSRSIQAMQNWVQKLIAPPNFDGEIVVLTNDNFERTVSSAPNALWFVKFHSPQCGHCKAMEQTWIDFAREMTGGNVIVAEVNVMIETDVATKFGIDRYPTLYLIQGRKMVQYDGARTVKDFKEFVQEGDVLKSGSGNRKILERPVMTVGADGFIEQFLQLTQEHPIIFFALIGIVIVTIVLCVTMVVCLMDGYESEPLKRPAVPPHASKPTNKLSVNDSNVPVTTTTTAANTSSLSANTLGAEMRSRTTKDKDY